MKTVLAVLLLTLTTLARADVAVAESQFVSEIVHIKYAKATDIAEALLELSAAESNKVASAPSELPYAPATRRLQEIIRRAAITGDLHMGGQQRVIPDERSNSILIFATREETELFKRHISALDLAQAQILIETAILKVPVPNPKRSHGEHSDPSSALADRILKTGMLQSTNFVFSPNTNATTAGQIQTYGYVGAPEDSFNKILGALIDALPAEVIQKPRILTSDGIPGTITVTKPFRFRSSSGYGPNSCMPPTEAIMSLKISPMIQPDGSLRLDLDVEDSKIVGTTLLSGVGEVPMAAHLDLAGSVSEDVGECILICGLVAPGDRRYSGIPILKSIPILGLPFRGWSSQQSQFVILVRPNVLRAPSAQ